MVYSLFDSCIRYSSYKEYYTLVPQHIANIPRTIMSGLGDTNGKSSAGGSSGKQRKRIKGAAPSSSGFSLSSLVPGEIVCTDRALRKSKTRTELALLLGVSIVGLYLFGFAELMESMPEISSKIAHYNMGANLNLAKMEMDSVISKIKKKKEDVFKKEETDHAGDTQRRTDQKKETSAKQQKKHKLHFTPTGGAHDNDKTNDEGGIPITHDKTNDDGDIPIPAGIWPVRFRDEEMETIIHVGDLKTVMKVPKFWSPPVHNKKQFTREQAMQIGTCAEPDPTTGSSVRGEDCPIDERTIFIGIASYRDFQCRMTLETAFRRAKNPNRVRVGVVDQIVVGEDFRCNEPEKPCEEDPEQVRILASKQNQIFYKYFSFSWCF